MQTYNFSVVIPLYNKERYIKSTIESVLGQTYSRFELIVIDDGSTDSSASIVAAIPDERIRLIQQTNAGVSAARNRGIINARYEYIAFLDADDLWNTDYLETIASLIDRFPSEGIYATFYRLDDGRSALVTPKLEPKLATMPEGRLQNYFIAATYGEQPFFTSSVCSPREILLSLGGFKFGVKHGEDLDMWARIALYHPIVYTREPKVIYRTKADARAMHSRPALTRWVFRTAAAEAIAPDKLDVSLVQAIKEHIARVELYIVIANILNPDHEAVCRFLHGIETNKFARRKTILYLILMLPLYIKRFIVKVYN